MATLPTRSESDFQQHNNPIQTWRGQWLGGLGLLAIALFTWLPRSYHRMAAWPYSLVWQAGFIALSFWLVWMLRQFKQPFQRLGHRLDLAILGIALSLILSSLFATHQAVALWNCLLVACYGALLYLLHNWIESKRFSYKRLWALLVVIATGTSLVSLAYWRPDPAMWLSNDFDDAIRNAYPLGHHNFTGGYFVLVSPIVISFAVAHKGWLRRGAILASLLCLAALYASGSRGAWLGGIAALFSSLGCALWHSSKANRRYLIVGLLISLVAVAGVLFSNPRVRNAVSFRANTSSNRSAAVTLADGPAKDRIFMARAAANMLKDRPLLGVGPGNMSRVFTRYRPIETFDRLVETPQLHNMPLQILGELGLLGALTYGFLLACLLGLGVRLWHVLSEPTDLALLYGLAASFLGYSISSLTDSQLENIGISSTIVIAIVLLLGLSRREVRSPLPTEDRAKAGAGQPVLALPKRARRTLSLLVLAFISLSLYLWIPVDAAMALTYNALKAGHQGQFVEADAKLSRAAQLVPWDPTYSALAAQNLITLYDQAEDDRAPLLNQAIAYYQMALTAAPRDAWFNHNLSVLSLEANQPEQAEYYATRNIQVLPRHANYTYYLLGISYLEQGKTQEAATAFSLQALIAPALMSAQMWTTEPFTEIRQTVVAQTNRYYTTLQKSLPNDHPYQRWLCEQSTILNWWHGQGESVVAADQTCLRPLTQILVLANENPQQAIQLVNQQLQSDPTSGNLALLRAWLDPDQYLDPYLSTSGFSSEEQLIVRETVYDNRDIIAWLNSSFTTPPAKRRRAASLTYRNRMANQANFILRPDGLRFSTLGKSFNLFGSSPTDFPELDRLMERVRTDELGITHPTQAGFS
ncbi:MAG: O-antigen ligase family protein [Cyanobacteria bacterium P01_D01_bin.14]